MMRKVCPNPDCGARTRNLKAIYCSQCMTLLDPPVEDQDTTFDETNDDQTQPEETTDVTENRRTLKEKIGGLVMNARTNWKAIGFATLALILLATLVLTYKLLSVNTWGIVALVGIFDLFLAAIVAFSQEIDPKPQHDKIKNILAVLGSILLVLAVLFGLLLPNTFSSTTNQKFVPGATTNSSNYQVGEPADIKDINNDVWNQPYSDAVMVGTDGTTSVYTQSGKDGSTTLTGMIPSKVALVVDSYNLTVNGKSYTNGNLLVIVNDSTTDKIIDNYGISYTNGCAQLISTSNLQKLLDENIAVKFSRGDWNKTTKQWSYSPWALNNTWIPKSYIYTPLKLTYKSDTYPNKDLATDTSVNTSGAK